LTVASATEGQEDCFGFPEPAGALKITDLPCVRAYHAFSLVLIGYIAQNPLVNFLNIHRTHQMSLRFNGSIVTVNKKEGETKVSL
jgi:hypothetical protein